MGPEARVYTLMLVALLAGGLIGALLIRNGWRRAYGAVFIGHVLAALGFFIAAGQGEEVQGLGHAIILAVFVLPALLGLLLGGGFAWWRARGS